MDIQGINVRGKIISDIMLVPMAMAGIRSSPGDKTKHCCLRESCSEKE